MLWCRKVPRLFSPVKGASDHLVAAANSTERRLRTQQRSFGQSRFGHLWVMTNIPVPTNENVKVAERFNLYHKITTALFIILW